MQNQRDTSIEHEQEQLENETLGNHRGAKESGKYRGHRYLKCRAVTINSDSVCIVKGKYSDGLDGKTVDCA